MRNKKLKNQLDILIITLIIIVLILPTFAFLQTQPVGPLQTSSEAKEIGIQAGREIQLNLSGSLRKIWREEIMTIWNFIKKLWNSYIFPKIKKLWQKITIPFKKEFEKRTFIIEKEFQKEKKEMKEEIKTELPKTSKSFKSLWQKFKELIKKN